MDKGLKNTATPFTMEAEVNMAGPQPEPTPGYIHPVDNSAADEESQSGSYAAAGETGIKSESFLH